MKQDRPVISSAHVGIQTTVEEAFQNTTIRPIIKQQHSRLIRITKSSIEKKIKGFDKLGIQDKTVRLSRILSKDQTLRKQLVELITELFTEEEQFQYFVIKKETNRRIRQIICERMLSSINELI